MPARGPIGDSALIEDLDRARVQAPGARADEILRRSQLDDCYVDTGQCQLAGQCQPGRTSSGDHYRVLGHFVNPICAASGNGGRCCITTRALRQGPPSAILWKWQGAADFRVIA